MLTADLVNTRLRDGVLRIVPLGPAARARALALANAFVAITRAHLGAPREVVERACGEIRVAAADRRLALGILKLIDDRCEYDAPMAGDPVALRREVFLRAAAARREGDGELDRAAVLHEVALGRGSDVDHVERGLYSDLRGAQALREARLASGEEIVDGYDLSQVQAVLLRSVSVRLHVRSERAASYRALFGRLKFLRLLHTIRAEPGEAGGYCIEVEGPFSMFESVTKYGLQLAMLVPALIEQERWSIEAEVRWGKTRSAVVFKHEGLGEGAASSVPATSPEVAALVVAFRDLDTPWTVKTSSEILELPGVGLCIPDVSFVHGSTGQVVYLEVLGFWSREAVWRRVELVRGGLPFTILFAVAKRLRVSAEVLEGDLPAALYVYKTTMSARAIAEHLDSLAGRAPRPTRASGPRDAPSSVHTGGASSMGRVAGGSSSTTRATAR